MNKSYKDYYDDIYCGRILLKDVPKEFIDKEMCTEAVRNSIYEFFYVPEEFITQEICERVVKYDCDLLRYLPEQFKKDAEIYIFALENSEFCEFEDIVRLMPESCMSSSIFEELVKYDPEFIYFTPYEYLTRDIISHNPNFIKDGIPELDKKTVLDLIKSAPLLLEYVPEDLVDREICKTAYNLDNSVLEVIKNKYNSFFKGNPLYMGEDIIRKHTNVLYEKAVSSNFKRMYNNIK